MSVTAFEMLFSGGATEQYEQVIAKMGFERHGKGAPGGLFHWVAKTDDGLKVVDVWASPEQFQKFADEQIGPLHAGGRARRASDHGLPGPQLPRRARRVAASSRFRPAEPNRGWVDYVCTLHHGQVGSVVVQ